MTRGLAIFETKGREIRENEDGSFCVPSQTSSGLSYEVALLGERYVCDCPDFEQREIEFCKHIHAVKFWIASQVYLQEQAKPKVFAADSLQCQKCGSIRVVKYGHSDSKQVYKCKDCGKKFRELSLLRKAHYSPEMVTLSLDLYFSGLSLRKITRAIQGQFNIDIHYSTVYGWIQKYIPVISEYANSFTPQLSDTWHADEVFVKMRNGIDYRKNQSIAFLWNVMDRKTRFLLASKLSPLRDHIGANRAFDEARRNAHGNYPQLVTTDSLKSYGHIKYNTSMGWEIKHIENVGIRSKNKVNPNNNRVERLNGTCRERIKVQRGWKSFETPIPEGFRIHYNFVKPHQALEGQTPAQRAGIAIPNNWGFLLEQAIRSKKSSSPENQRASASP